MYTTSPRARSRQAGFVVAVLTLAVAYACSDNTVGPRAGPEVRSSGRWVSSLWEPSATGLQYVSSVSGEAEVIANGNGVTVNQTNVREVPLGPLEIESLRSSLNRTPLGSSEALLGAGRSAPLPAPPGSIVRSFKTRSLRLEGENGEKLRLDFVDHPLGGGRPPLAVMIYKDERPIALNEYGYEHEGSGWRAVRSRSSLFDASGKVTLIADQDLSGIRRGRVAPSIGSARWLRDGVGGVAAKLAELVQPDAAYAAIPLTGPCSNESLALAIAVAKEAAAAGALLLARGACIRFPPSCSLALFVAQANWAAADLALGKATAEYYACQSRNPDPPPSSGGGSGGGGGGGVGGAACEAVIIEISYDGGATWHYLGTAQAC